MVITMVTEKLYRTEKYLNELDNMYHKDVNIALEKEKVKCCDNCMNFDNEKFYCVEHRKIILNSDSYVCENVIKNE
jgi:hypothetical protein